MRTVPLSLIAGLLLACGPERTLSGVWQQVDCGDGDVACENDLLYELHLGRFGDKVSGVVVRYTFQGTELDNFGKNAECGCFVVENGRAQGDRIAFSLFRPGTPGQSREVPDLTCRWPDETRNLVDTTECAGRQFRLAAEDGDDRLVGVVECADQRSQPITFRRVTGRTRDRCVQPDP